MKAQLKLLLLASATSLAFVGQVQAKPIEIQFWHSMEQKLGEEVDKIASDFNASQQDYKVKPVYKGNYEESMSAGIAAYRGGSAPHIIQVYEVGTATMMSAKGAIKPIYDLTKETGVSINLSDYIPTVAGYYSNDQGLISMPFNSSSPVLYWNKDAFKKAGLNPETPPKTWQEVGEFATKLKNSGSKCGFTTAWQSWVLLENGTAWNGAAFATRNNGFDGLDAKLQINTPLTVEIIEDASNMVKKGTMTYSGRKSEAASRFYSGDCAIAILSSGSLANVEYNAKFKFGVGYMPYMQGVKDAPQNPVIGGASLWVMGGKSKQEYKGVATFLKYLSTPKVAAAWHQNTGYLPITTEAYNATKAAGFYDKNPLAEVVVKQLQNKAPLSFTKGIRLGNLPQIRTIIDEELEAVWGGKKTAKQALETASKRSEVLLRRFEKANK